MRNCLIAQSGGPTSVINSSVAGIVSANSKTGFYDNVYAGINGIEGILNNKIMNLSNLNKDRLNLFMHTPSSGLGSCRYKMKDFTQSVKEYEDFFNLLNKLEISTFFYVGGNDSMDTVSKLSAYAFLHNISKQIIGIPKTIDNDLVITDHTPGFGSAAKLISTITLETYLDSSVYINNGVFILETMGRDTGWLAASAALAKLEGKPVADFIYLPEAPFSREAFINDVSRRFKEQNQAYIVVSEGVKDEKGNFLTELNTSGSHDKFGHIQLGGVCGYLKQIVMEAGITKRVKTLELGVIQRCAMHIASDTDLIEAFNAGKAAYDYSLEGVTGHMVGIRRISDSPYASENFLIKASEVCNKIKYIPRNWINKEGNNVLQEAVSYIDPLVMGIPQLQYCSGIPEYISVK